VQWPVIVLLEEIFYVAFEKTIKPTVLEFPLFTVPPNPNQMDLLTFLSKTTDS